MIWRWPSQNTFRIWTMLYWTRSSRTEFDASINVWRLAGSLWTLLVTFYIVIIKCTETFWSPCTSNNRGPLVQKFKRLAFKFELTDGFRGHPGYRILFTSWVISTLERDVPCVTWASSLSPPDVVTCELWRGKTAERSERASYIHVNP